MFEIVFLSSQSLLNVDSKLLKKKKLNRILKKKKKIETHCPSKPYILTNNKCDNNKCDEYVRKYFTKTRMGSAKLASFDPTYILPSHLLRVVFL